MGVEQKIIEAVAKVAKRKIEEIRLDSRFEDLGMDSLDKVTLLFELEQTFDISIPEAEVQGIETVGDIVGRLEAFISSSSAGGPMPSGSPS